MEGWISQCAPHPFEKTMDSFPTSSVTPVTYPLDRVGPVRCRPRLLPPLPYIVVVCFLFEQEEMLTEQLFLL